jgi:hypothetical protein
MSTIISWTDEIWNPVRRCMNEQTEVRLENMNMNKLMNEREAAEILGCTISAMRKWRLLGKGPIYCKIPLLVRYSLSELQGYMESCRVGGNNNG